MTCHNREEKTLLCLGALTSQIKITQHYISIYLVDDGSSDGTTEKIRSIYPNVNLIQGTGSLYWGGGMALAYNIASTNNYDYYLWLNDDTELYNQAIYSLLKCEESHLQSQLTKAIIVGSTCDDEEKHTTYGGRAKSSFWQRTSFKIIPCSNNVQRCDTMNGNCVLIPCEIAKELQNIDHFFIHVMGDFDYGLRAKKLGYDILIAPKHIGQCNRNSERGTFNDNTLTSLTRMKHMLSIKGMPLKAWLVFTFRHTGLFWPIYFIWPYSKVAVNAIYNDIKAILIKIYQRNRGNKY